MPAPIRVLQLGSPTGLYGAERWILALVRNLSARDVTSLVGSIQDTDGAEPEICKAAEAAGFQSLTIHARGRANPLAISRLREVLLQQDIQVLHTHGYKSDLIGVLAAAGTGCRVVATPHGWSKDAGLALRAYELLDRCAFTFADAICPLSDDLHAGLQAWPFVASKLRLIRNGVDLEEVDRGHPSSATDRKSHDRFIVGYVGQLIPRKGVDLLIRALSKLNSRDVTLWVVGEGPMRPELEELASSLAVADRVRFFGYRLDRIALLRQMDCFALPSYLEGVPRCLMEAMAARIPVVASDIPGNTEVILHQSTGLLFKPGDSRSLAEAMQRYIELPGLREKVRAAAETRVRELFSAARMAVEYAELYRQLVDRR